MRAKINLENICFTLQTGRETLDERLGIIASNFDELIEKLELYCNQPMHEVKEFSSKDKAALSEVLSKEDTNLLIKTLFEHNQLEKIAKLWEMGIPIDWKILYHSKPFKKIPLPTYPFSRERYWNQNIINNIQNSPLVSYPIISHSESVNGINTHIFNKIYNPTDIIIADHQVEQQGILPAAGLLDIAYSILTSALKDHTKFNLCNVIFHQPLIVNQTVEITYELTKIENKTCFKIMDKNDPNIKLFTTGEYIIKPEKIDRKLVNYLPFLQRLRTVIYQQDIYSIFSQIGIHYGNYFKALQALYTDNKEALGIIELPDNLINELKNYHLHPSLLDGVLQVVLGYIVIQKKDASKMLPFSMDEVKIYGPLEKQIYCYLKESSENKFDLLVLNNEGLVLVEIVNLVARKSKLPDLKTACYSTCWEKIAKKDILDRIIENKNCLLIYTPQTKNLMAQLQNLLDNLSISHRAIEFKNQTILAADDLANCLQTYTIFEHIYFFGCIETESKEYNNGLMQFFHLIKHLNKVNRLNGISLTIFTQSLVQVFPEENLNPTNAGIIGFVKCLAKEASLSQCKLIDIKLDENDWCLAENDLKTIFFLLQQNIKASIMEMAVREGEIYQPVLYPVTLNKSKQSCFKKNGVYLIVGGAGGIGLELCDYLAKNYQANIALIGRNQLNESQIKKIEIIKSLGSDIKYFQGDITDIQRSEEIINKVINLFGNINGVIHAAVVLNDVLISKLSEHLLSQTLAPKVEGSKVLAEIFKNRHLDFMLFFSSSLSLVGHPGQSNYAAGCTFKDIFSLSLNNITSYPVKVINWGFWGSVGIVASPAYNQRLNQLGLYSINPNEGFAAMEDFLSSPLKQIAIIKADYQFLKSLQLNEDIYMSIAHQEKFSAIENLNIKFKSYLNTLNENDYSTLSKGFQLLELYCLYKILSLLVNKETLTSNNTSMSIKEIELKLSITSKYQNLFKALMHFLLINNLLVINQENQLQLTTYSLSLIKKLDNHISELKNNLLKNFPEINSYLQLVEDCFNHYPELLSGSKSPLDILFPNGSTQKVEAIYGANEYSGIYNNLIALYIKNYINTCLSLNNKLKIRILEVGAGTGATSDIVLKEISEYRSQVKYIFSDISQIFINRAKEKYEFSYPFVDYCLLNIDEDNSFSNQIESQSIDIIIASNVIHATKNITNTLTFLKHLLKRNGLLIINEIVNCTTFSTVCFGLTEGWWLFEDSNIREPYSPVVKLDTWIKQLTENGYTHAHAYNLPGIQEKNAWQAIIVAENNGILLNKILNKPHEKNFLTNENNAMTPNEALNISNTINIETVQNYIIKIFSKSLKIDEKVFNINSTFEKYGIDSLIGIEIKNRFEKDLGKLPSTLLFDNITISTLAHYLFENKKEALNKILLNNISDIQCQETKIYIPSNTDRKSPNPTPHRLNFTKNEEEDIAIVGLSGRYPMAESLDEFLLNLRMGKNCISEIPLARWNWRDYLSPTSNMPAQFEGKWAGLLDNVDCFDADFFGISSEEAILMDPQERIMLELAWQVLEDAGYTRTYLLESPLKAAVYLGVMNPDYEWLSANAHAKGHANYAYSRFWSIANRISYYFNLKGPSLAIDTACSSSLSAIHLAVQSLKNKECEIAIAGGINLILHPIHLQRLAKDKLLTNGNTCNTFSNDANGFVDGEGAGLLILKPLYKARQDGNIIYGIIKGSSVNAGGKSSGYLTPHRNALAELVEQAFNDNNIPFSSINYIETAVAGSPMGDAIEVSALNKVFSNHLQKCAIGSVKSNIGHLEAASGIAAVTKVLMQLKHKELYPTINCENINPNIDLDNSPFYIQKEYSEWQTFSLNSIEKKQMRKACINSFGAGGANAHLIIQEYQSQSNSTTIIEQPVAIIISAKNSESIKNYVKKLISHLDINKNYYSNDKLASMAYTLQICREHHKNRVAFIVKSLDELSVLMKSFLGNEINSPQIIVPSQQSKFDQPTQLTISNTLDLIEISQHWVNGNFFDWNKLYTDNKPEQISLPGYCFLKNKYFLGHPSQLSSMSENSEPNIQQSQQSLIDLEDSTILTYMQTQLISLLSNILEVAPHELDAGDDLSQYGLDSLKVIQFIDSISKYYSLVLPPAIYYGHYSIAQFTNTLFSEYKPNFYTFYKTTFTKISSTHASSDGKKELQIKNSSEGIDEPIAIVGIAGVFPQAKNIDEFWQNLVNGKDSITTIPPERWQWNNKNLENPSDCGLHYGGFIDNIDKFDAEFFNISHQEAKLMDPQQRIFLELVWKCIEDAGFSPYDLWNTKTGVFVGISNSDYIKLMQEVKKEAHISTGNAPSILANRVSYFLNLRGPSEPIDTGCSSSLVAVYKAVESLRNGKCNFAIAGGVNAILSPDMYQIFSDAGMLSPTGRCKSFDDKADGYVRGEGAGVIFLMPLSKALKYKAPIYAVIKGGAVNHGGRTSSMTAPNPIAQKELLLDAYQTANIDFETITYIETHGTGTKLGDPIEIKALINASQDIHLAHPEHQPLPCALGALKSNIGHLESAAGIAGLIKVVLSIKHKLLPRNIHFNKLNSHISLDNSPFYILDKNQPWKNITLSNGYTVPLRAGISSFGFGGVNAHLILEEVPYHEKNKVHNLHQYYVIPVSAENLEQLDESIQNLLYFINKNMLTRTQISDKENDIDLIDLAYTLQVGRTPMKVRAIFIVENVQELAYYLELYLKSEKEKINNYYEGNIKNYRQIDAVSKRKETYNDFSGNKEELLKIGKAWAQGSNIDWGFLYNQELLPNRISLPSYPFSKQSHWIIPFNSNNQDVNSIKNLVTSAVAKKEGIIKEINNAIAKILSMDPLHIDIEKNLSDLGLDSVMGIKLVKVLSNIFNITIQPQLIFENPTVLALAICLETKVEEQAIEQSSNLIN